VLDLRRSQLAELPDLPFKPSLYALDVAENELQTVPADWVHTQTLTWASFRSNQLQVLPDAFCACSSLTDLDLSFNSLLALPAELCLPQLKRLLLAHNRLTTLPHSLGECWQLQVLDISHNPGQKSSALDGKIVFSDGNYLLQSSSMAS
jgi:Leucine-rich repeat (LRR) protein